MEGLNVCSWLIPMKSFCFLLHTQIGLYTMRHRLSVHLTGIIHSSLGFNEKQNSPLPCLKLTATLQVKSCRMCHSPVLMILFPDAVSNTKMSLKMQL